MFTSSFFIGSLSSPEVGLGLGLVKLNSRSLLSVGMVNPNVTLWGQVEIESESAQRPPSSCLLEASLSTWGQGSQAPLSAAPTPYPGSPGLGSPQAGWAPSDTDGPASHAAPMLRGAFWNHSREAAGPSREQGSPRKNFRIEHCLKTKGWIWPQINTPHLERKSESPVGHGSRPAVLKSPPSPQFSEEPSRLFQDGKANPCSWRLRCPLGAPLKMRPLQCIRGCVVLSGFVHGVSSSRVWIP
ncbi:hypothetical protein HJG60_009992 [Phyllostomus discolor]|uniref:Uncharacterized protein n=1 Tax=Phyllostomus discolor TaxID=89673 RepID=A0A834BAK3_9CHIR|nr:hypothetical protein HJG60_009992 [Phyllostomus discolor]